MSSAHFICRAGNVSALSTFHRLGIYQLCRYPEARFDKWAIDGSKMPKRDLLAPCCFSLSLPSLNWSIESRVTRTSCPAVLEEPRCRSVGSSKMQIYGPQEAWSKRRNGNLLYSPRLADSTLSVRKLSRNFRRHTNCTAPCNASATYPSPSTSTFTSTLRRTPPEFEVLNAASRLRLRPLTSTNFYSLHYS